MKAILTVLLMTLSVSACVQLRRSPEATSDSTFREPQDRETRKTAYELGKDPSQLTAQDHDDIQNRQKALQLERTLSSKKEREQYSKVLPWLKNDAEKISFLSIPSIEGRQQWINRNNIWSRTQTPPEDLKQLLEAQDIAIGMPQEYVRRSWGEPQNVEVSGNPIYKNERWRYQRQVSTPQGYRQEIRYVYFEAGRVVGWETE